MFLGWLLGREARSEKRAEEPNVLFVKIFVLSLEEIQRCYAEISLSACHVDVNAKGDRFGKLEDSEFVISFRRKPASKPNA